MELINTFFNGEILIRSFPILLRGLGNTLLLGSASIIFGCLAGLLICLMRLYGPRPVRLAAIFYVDMFRALPILVVLLSAMGVVTPRFLLRNFRWAVLVIFTVSALITPTPDILNLSLFAVPALVLYLLGIGVAWFVAPRKREEADETTPTADIPAP